MTVKTGPVTPMRMVAAVAAFGAMLAVFIVWIAANLTETSDLRTAFETRLDILSALKARPVAALASGQEADGDNVILAPSDTIAASALQRRIVGIVEDDGARLQSVQVESDPDGAVNGLNKLRAQLSFEVTIDKLQKILFTLETGEPYCFVESLAMQPATVQQASAGQGQTLRVTLAASSFWMPGGKQ